MSRRALTLLLASALAVGMVLTAAVARVPYVALGPGPTYDTLGSVDGTPVLQVEGRETFPTDGQLDLTTVGVQPRLTLAQALQAWFADDLAVVPREVVFPPDQSDEEVDAANQQAMQQSQSAAVLAAARQLGLPVGEVRVREVAADGPSAGTLRPGDVLVAVDGRPVRDVTELRDLIGQREAGQPVDVSYRRDGREASARITTATADGDGERRPVIGVVPEDVAVDVPFDVEISLQDVGGPSAGLMFTLGILDKLGPESLTGGAYIAGTGEISPDGRVGPIGGIQQKLIAASRKGAEAFLVPAENCDEAVSSPPDGLVLVRVATLSDALTGLEALREERSPDTCPA